MFDTWTFLDPEPLAKLCYTVNWLAVSITVLYMVSMCNYRTKDRNNDVIGGLAVLWLFRAIGNIIVDLCTLGWTNGDTVTVVLLVSIILLTVVSVRAAKSSSLP